MALAGTHLFPRDVAALAHTAGWRDHALNIAVAVCSAESDRYTQAINTENADGSIDYGLWQINSVHFGQTIGGHFVNEAALYDPATNAAIAYALWKAAAWQPWAAHTSGAYLAEMGGALNGIRNYWRLHYGLDVAG